MAFTADTRLIVPRQPDPAIEFLRTLRRNGGWVRAGRKGFRIFVGLSAVAHPHEVLDEAQPLRERLRYLVTPATPSPHRPRKPISGRWRDEA